MKRSVVIALGGNAILKKGERPSVAIQFKNTQRAMQFILPLLQNKQVILTFGNAPQVGNILIRSEQAKKKAYPISLEIAVAESEGEMGYMVEQCLRNVLKKHRINQEIVSIVTQVLVDKNDPGFKHPTKPIGPFYSKKKAQQMKKNGIAIVEDAGRGWRRVVASPVPKKVLEANSIKKLMETTIVIAAGGGGVPVIQVNGELRGREAVIDKDLASARLAIDVHAEELWIITGVKKVSLNYNTAQQQEIKQMNVKQAQTYLKEGHFPEGSMGPKIQAAIQFLKAGGKKVVITCPACVPKALKGREGTIITR